MCRAERGPPRPACARGLRRGRSPWPTGGPHRGALPPRPPLARRPAPARTARPVRPAASARPSGGVQVALAAGRGPLPGAPSPTGRRTPLPPGRSRPQARDSDRAPTHTRPAVCSCRDSARRALHRARGRRRRAGQRLRRAGVPPRRAVETSYGRAALGGRALLRGLGRVVALSAGDESACGQGQAGFPRHEQQKRCCIRCLFHGRGFSIPRAGCEFRWTVSGLRRPIAAAAQSRILGNMRSTAASYLVMRETPPKREDGQGWPQLQLLTITGAAHLIRHGSREVFQTRAGSNQPSSMGGAARWPR